MINRLLTVVLLLVLLVTLSGSARAKTITPIDQPALVYVELGSSDDMTRFATTQMPMVAVLEHGMLTIASLPEQEALLEAGLNLRILDSDPYSGTYYLARTHFSRPNPDYTSFGQVLLNTGKGVLLRMDPSQVDSLVKTGAELQSITMTPKPLPTTQSEEVFPDVVEPDPIIQGMIDQVTETQVYTYDRQLAGELPVWVDGSPYTISSRYTYSGTPIQKTTNFVGQHMADLGMNVDYHVWNNTTNPDVIGEIPGLFNPGDIYIIGAHIDDVNGTKGADDNASGSVATLLAADIISQYQWGCTLRFAFWTGEEQGLLGSHSYAQEAHNAAENIIGYLNLDMIAWNTIKSPAGIDIIYHAGLPATLELAQLFADVIDVYNINLIPELGTSLGGGSDHSSFWSYNYTAILSIEDQNDFNPYYHGTGDTPAHTDLSYFANFVRASVGTFAHMSGCLVGYLDGHVTSAGNSSPLEGATVTASNSQGDAYPAATDANGYYTLTLPVDTYTVTVSAESHLPTEVSGVEVIADTTITRDFALQPGCEPLAGLDFTWLPLEPNNSDLVSFTAMVDGTNPVEFQWSFGDTLTGTGSIVIHAYPNAGTYTVNLTATNACSTNSVSKYLTIQQSMLNIFLPQLYK